MFEHERLRIGDQQLTSEEFDALVAFNAKHDDQFFVVGHRSLKFKSYVGALRVGHLTIEILPKADRGQESKDAWRNVLLEMLRVAGHLNLESAGSADLHLHRRSLFDLYMDAFLTEVDRLTHRGLVRKYRHVIGNVTSLKGRLLTSQHAIRNVAHGERFLTSHLRYDRNNLPNRILATASRVVAQVTGDDAVRRRARGSLPWLEDVESLTATARTFSRLRYDRSTTPYRTAIELARMILLGFQPDIRFGHHHVLALLFDMNELFERYVLRLLQNAARKAPGEVRIDGQVSQVFWIAENSRRRLRPDIVLTLSPRVGPETVLLDTKWKVPKGEHPDDQDLRQMYAYNLQFGARRSFLLYPQVAQRLNVKGSFCPAATANVPGHHCGMWFLDLLQDGHLNPHAGSHLLQAIADSGRWPSEA